MDHIGTAFDLYVRKSKKKKKKLKNLYILFWNFLKENIIAYNIDGPFIVLLKLTGNFYELNQQNFYTSVGKYLTNDGKQMKELTKNPESINAMFMTTISGKKKFSPEFFRWKNTIFYYCRDNIYSTIVRLNVECPYRFTTYTILVKIINPPSNIIILDFEYFKLYASINNPPTDIVENDCVRHLLNTFPSRYSEILEYCSQDLRYCKIPEEHVILKGSPLKVEQYIQLSVYNNCFFNTYNSSNPMYWKIMKFKTSIK